MRFVFIIGTGRCGSTQLSQIVASHPDVGFVSNLERRAPGPLRGGRSGVALAGIASRSATLLAGDGRGRRGTPGWRSLPAKRLWALAGPSEAYQLLADEVSPMLAVPCRDLTAADAFPWIDARLRAFFGEAARRHGKPVFMHKFTGWPRARFLNAVFPEAKFVHLVRDGRAVANSLMQVRFWQGYRGPLDWTTGPLPAPYAHEWEESGRSFAVLAGLEWKMLMDAFDESERAIPAERWLNVRFEDVLVDPRQELERIFSFAELDWASDVERRLRASSMTRSRGDAYLAELGEQEVALLDTSLAGHLKRWGY